MDLITEIQDDTDYNNFVKTHERALMFFGSVRCHYCQDMKLYAERLAEERPDISVAHIEVTKVEVTGIEGVPVFLLYQDGEMVGSQVGAGAQRLNNLIEEKLPQL